MRASPPERLLNRIRAEYLEMPGLRLKPEQLQRLCDVERTICQMVLNLLVDDKFLRVTLDGHYARLTDGEIVRPHTAKADPAEPSDVLAADVVEYRAFGRHHDPRMTARNGRGVQPHLNLGSPSDHVFAD
jgi:hypothetical protein